jgi:hypothetical protein
MKTPREILLNRHRSAAPKLDAVRETALAEAFTRTEQNADQPAEIRAPFAIRVAQVLWRELIFPCRRIWAGLAAVWMLILVLNMPAGEKHTQLAQIASPPDKQVLAVLREQKEMLAQFIEPMMPSPAIRPKIPGPRGELLQTITLV